MITETIKRNGRTQAVINLNEDGHLLRVDLWNEELSEFIAVDLISLVTKKNSKLYALVQSQLNQLQDTRFNRSI